MTVPRRHRGRGLTRGLPGCPGPGAAPPVSPHPGVTGTRPASPPQPGGGSGVPGEDPAFPRNFRSPGTGPSDSEGTDARSPGPVCAPPGHPAGHCPGEVGRWTWGHGRPPHPPRPAPSRSQFPDGNKPALTPSPNPPTHCPLQAHPETPSSDRQLGTPNARGVSTPPTMHHPIPARMSRVAPATLKRCHPSQHPPTQPGWGWGPPCPRRAPVPGS